MAFVPEEEARKKDDSSTAVIVIGGLFGLGALATAIGFAVSGSKKKPEPDPDPNPNPEPDPAPAPDPNPAPAPDAGELKFDLENNWGAVPPDMRELFAKAELAFRIPGLGRFEAVKAWSAFRAGQDYVTQEEAAAIWAAKPYLNKDAIAEIDAGDAKSLLDKNIAAGWVAPKDYDGWRLGSFGFFDILGPNIAWAGVHVLPKDQLPFVNLNAVEAGANLQVQFDTVAYIVWRILIAPGYKVLKPGPNSAAGDSLQTWGNIASAYASPSAYIAQNDYAKNAKQRFLERALELGIDLAKNAYPWPPGMKYGKADWDWLAGVKRLQEYADKPISHSADVPGAVPPPPPPPNLPPPAVSLLVDVGGGVKARLFDNGIPSAQLAPLMVVLHGRNASESQLQALVKQTVTKARLAFLRGPIGSGTSWRWFDPPLGTPSISLDQALSIATGKVVAAINELRKRYPQTSEVATVGYSQGGAIAYRLAAMTESTPIVGSVVAIAGWIPTNLRPTKPITARVFGIHGKKDANIAVKKAEETIASLKGPSTALEIVANGTHNITTLAPAIKARLSK